MPESFHKDNLTGFAQREDLQLFLRDLTAQSGAQGRVFSLVVIDVDRFKAFNDRYGHLFGDEILKYTASTLRLTFFEGPCRLFRYGGDEFIAIFPDKRPRELCSIFRQCYHSLHRRPCLYKNRFYRVTISCGISGFPDDARTPEALIQTADEAMYFSKKTGRNRATPYGRIGFLRVRRLIVFWAALGTILAIGIPLGLLTFRGFIQPRLSQLRLVKMMAAPEGLDTVILRDGQSFEGVILTENSRGVIMRLYFPGGGEGQMNFKRSEIAQIQYDKNQ